MQLISSFTPTEFEEFIKVVKTLNANGAISVRQNKLMQQFNTAIIIAEWEGNIPNLNFASVNLKLLDNLKRTKNDIEIYDAGPLYIITNKELSVKVPKAHEKIQIDSDVKIEGELVAEVAIDDIFAQMLFDSISDYQANLHIDGDNNLIGVSNDEVDAVFPVFAGEINATALEDKTEQKLVSKAFLPVRIKKSPYTFRLYKNGNNDILVTECVYGGITITAVEYIMPSDLDSLI